MGKIVIIADSTCDLNENFQKEYDILILPGHITLPDNSEVLSSFSWDDFGGRENFYSNLKKSPDSYKTSPPNTYEFAKIFEEYASKGYDIIALTISSGISGAYGFAKTAMETVKNKYKNIKIECIDSLRFGPGFGLIVLYAAIMRNENKSFEEIVDNLEKTKNKFHQCGWLDDLSFVAKKGRLTHSKAFFGTLAGVKPIGEFDYNGLTTIIGKIKGTKTAFNAILYYMEKTIENPDEQIIFIAQTNRLPQAEEFKKLIEEKFHPKAIYINDVFPPCGINIGPGLMAAYYIGTPISENLTVEKGIIQKFTEENK